MDNSQNNEFLNNQNLNNQVQNSFVNKPEKKKNIVAALLIIFGVVAIVFGLISLLFGNKGNKNLGKGEDAFFLSDSKGNYAIFNKSGKKITDFVYKNVSDFANGSAKASNMKGEETIVSSSGKELVKYGTCRYLYNQGALYECVDEKYNSTYLDSKGRKILEGSNFQLLSTSSSRPYSIIKDKKAKKFVIYNYNGKVIASIPFADNGNANPDEEYTDNYDYIYYNGVNYIFDFSKSKLLLSFKDDNNNRYCIKHINKENGDMTVGTCGSRNKDSGVYKYIKNNKVIYTKKAKYTGDLVFSGNNVIFKNDKDYLLDDKGNEVVGIYQASYKDYKNYAKVTEEGVNIYVDSKLKETVKCRGIESGYSKYGIYALNHCTGLGDNNSIYVDSNGKKLGNNSYRVVNKFDDNGYGVVSSEYGKYYLIDLKGNRISGKYADTDSGVRVYPIEGTKNTYLLVENGSKTLFKVINSKVVDNSVIKSKDITTNKNNDVVYAIIEKDSKYIVKNLENYKDVVTLDKKPSFNKEYFTVYNNGVTEYYSYNTGKMFYKK